MIFNKQLTLICSTTSCELAVIQLAPTSLLNLLISISSETGHICFGDGAVTYKVHGYLREVLQDSELSLWS